MKKTVLSIISAVMIIAMALTLTGCSDNGKFVGKWKADLDVSEILAESLKEDKESAELAEYFDMKDLSDISLTFEFKKDGTYSAKFDETSFNNFSDSLRAVVEDAANKMLGDELKAAGLDMDLEAFLALAGINIGDLVDEAMKEIDFEDLVKECETEGKFKAEGGKLYMTDSMDEEIDEEEYNTYEIAGSEIKLIDYHGEEETMVNKMFPVTLVKQ